MDTTTLILKFVRIVLNVYIIFRFHDKMNKTRVAYYLFYTPGTNTVLFTTLFV